MAEPHPIVRELDKIRRARKITLDQLAAKTTVSKTCLSEIANGHHVPRIDTVEKVARGLGVHLAVVVDEEDGR